MEGKKGLSIDLGYPLTPYFNRIIEVENLLSYFRQGTPYNSISTLKSFKMK